MSFMVIQGKWCHQDGESLNPIERNQLSKQINNLKPIAKITPRDNLQAIYHLMNTKSNKIDLISKIFNQSDSAIAIINSKI